jgi:hypothetical protein
MSCNPNFEAGFGSGVLTVVLVLLCVRLFRKPALPVEPYQCQCGRTEVVVEAVPVSSVFI